MSTSDIEYTRRNCEPWRWRALVLAADRHDHDAVAVAAGVSCKAMASVAGDPLLARVLRALRQSDPVERIMLLGPAREALSGDAELEQSVTGGEVDWRASADSPSASVLLGLQALPPQRPVLVTTADHALLSPRIVDFFLQRAQESDCDFVVGVASLKTIHARFPGHRRTAIRLHGGPYSGCNLFAVTNERGRRLVDFWRRVERQRKKPWRVVFGALGWRAVVRYLSGRLTLEQAMRIVSRRLDLRVGAVVLPFAEAAIDVDTPEDREFVESVLRQCSVQP